MPSEHIVLLTKISKITPHANADKLEITEIEGWQVVTGKGNHATGDRVIFVPVDSVVPEEWAKKWGVYEYLGGKAHNRVRCVKLRQKPSYGFIVPVPEELSKKKCGTDVKDYFGITKYLPPIRKEQGGTQGTPRTQHPLFQKYTSIENMRNFWGNFQTGESVVVTEKIHGANFRIGLVDSQLPKKDFVSKFLRFFRIKNRTKLVEEFVAGSHNVQRKIPKNPKDMPYTSPLADKSVTELLTNIKSKYRAKRVIMYGEVYGPSIQKLHYGVTEGTKYMVFDILVNEDYLSWSVLKSFCDGYKIPTVPVLFEGAFSSQMIKELGEGKTTVKGAKHIREGVVVKPEVETTKRRHRKILKYKGADYLMWKDSKKGSDYTEN